jgi:hypothetical protein
VPRVRNSTEGSDLVGVFVAGATTWNEPARRGCGTELAMIETLRPAAHPSSECPAVAQRGHVDAAFARDRSRT